MNTGESYWHQRIQSQRVRRRSLLQGAAGLGVSATVLSLLGCGGGSSSSSSTSDKQGSASKLLSPVEDTSSKATKGGILPYFSANDTPGFTVYPGLSSFIPMHNDRAYSKFVKSVFANRAKGEQPLSTVEGDLAESFEISPDGLQITMKLRPNVLFDPGRRPMAAPLQSTMSTTRGTCTSRNIVPGHSSLTKRTRAHQYFLSPHRTPRRWSGSWRFLRPRCWPT